MKVFSTFFVSENIVASSYWNLLNCKNRHDGGDDGDDYYYCYFWSWLCLGHVPHQSGVKSWLPGNCLRLHWPAFSPKVSAENSSKEQLHTCVYGNLHESIISVDLEPLGAEIVRFEWLTIQKVAIRSLEETGDKWLEIPYLFGTNGLVKSGIGCALGTCSFLNCLISISSSTCRRTHHTMVSVLASEKMNLNTWCCNFQVDGNMVYL